MISALEIALREVLFSIPDEILNFVFRPAEKGVSLDQCIRQDVIEFRVIRDCNIYSGQYRKIPLRECDYKITPLEPGMGAVLPVTAGLWVVPPERRDFKNIASVLGVTFPGTSEIYNGSFPYNPHPGTMIGAAMATLESHMPAETGWVPTAVYMGNNTIKLVPGTDTQMDWIIEARLEYDTEMMSMSPDSIHDFSAMCVHAAKYHIYNYSVIKMGEGFIHSGKELGVFKDTIDKYEDSAELYKEAMLRFRGSELFNPQYFSQLNSIMML